MGDTHHGLYVKLPLDALSECEGQREWQDWLTDGASAGGGVGGKGGAAARTWVGCRRLAGRRVAGRQCSAKVLLLLAGMVGSMAKGQWRQVSILVDDELASDLPQPGNLIHPTFENCGLKSEHGQDDLVIETLGGLEGGFFVEVVSALVDHREGSTVYDPRLEMDGFAGIVREEFMNSESKPTNKNQFLMPTTTLARILDDMHAPHVIDYLSLDVEGAEGDVLEGMNWEAHTVRLITVERTSEKASSILLSQGYVKMGRWEGHDDLWAHAELAAQFPNA